MRIFDHSHRPDRNTKPADMVSSCDVACLVTM
jgi:hypothetical protein